MKLSVQIDTQRWEIKSRTGERFICRAILGPVVEAGQGVTLSDHALAAAQAVASGLTGYHWDGPPAFQVQVLD